eukprot:2085468-Karenia_brevis.AAC.1
MESSIVQPARRPRLSKKQKVEEDSAQQQRPLSPPDERHFQRPSRCSTECETQWVLDSPIPNICEVLGYDLNAPDTASRHRGLQNLGDT